jgi:hypothetical protein
MESERRRFIPHCVKGLCCGIGRISVCDLSASSTLLGGDIELDATLLVTNGTLGVIGATHRLPLILPVGSVIGPEMDGLKGRVFLS